MEWVALDFVSLDSTCFLQYLEFQGLHCPSLSDQVLNELLNFIEFMSKNIGGKLSTMQKRRMFYIQNILPIERKQNTMSWIKPLVAWYLHLLTLSIF